MRVLYGLSCSKARQTIRRYFQKVLASLDEPETGCAYVRTTEGCQVRSFRCFSQNSPLRGTCEGAQGVTHFREEDIGPR